LSSQKAIEYNFFGDALNEALKIKGLTQSEFADLMDIYESQVSRWINNQVVPYKSTISNIEKLISISFIKKDGKYTIKKHQEDEKEVNEDDTPYTGDPDRIKLSKLIRENQQLKAQVDILSELILKLK